MKHDGKRKEAGIIMEENDVRYLDYLLSDLCKDGGSFEEYLESLRSNEYDKYEDDYDSNW